MVGTFGEDSIRIVVESLHCMPESNIVCQIYIKLNKMELNKQKKRQKKTLKVNNYPQSYREEKNVNNYSQSYSALVLNRFYLLVCLLLKVYSISELYFQPNALPQSYLGSDYSSIISRTFNIYPKQDLIYKDTCFNFMWKNSLA